MKKYHLKTLVNGEENIFLIEADNPDDALRQAIEWANQNYECIEVYDGHPEDGLLERMSMDSAPYKPSPKKVELKVTQPQPPPKKVELKVAARHPPPPKPVKPTAHIKTKSLQAIPNYRDWLRENTGYPATRVIMRFAYIITMVALVIFLVGLVVSIVKKDFTLVAASLGGFSVFLTIFSIIEASSVLFDIADSTLDKNRRSNRQDVGISDGFDIEKVTTAVAAAGTLADLGTSSVPNPIEKA